MFFLMVRVSYACEYIRLYVNDYCCGRFCRIYVILFVENNCTFFNIHFIFFCFIFHTTFFFQNAKYQYPSNIVNAHVYTHTHTHLYSEFSVDIFFFKFSYVGEMKNLLPLFFHKNFHGKRPIIILYCFSFCTKFKNCTKNIVRKLSENCGHARNDFHLSKLTYLLSRLTAHCMVFLGTANPLLANLMMLLLFSGHKDLSLLLLRILLIQIRIISLHYATFFLYFSPKKYQKNYTCTKLYRSEIIFYLFIFRFEITITVILFDG